MTTGALHMGTALRFLNNLTTFGTLSELLACFQLHGDPCATLSLMEQLIAVRAMSLRTGATKMVICCLINEPYTIFILAGQVVWVFNDGPITNNFFKTLPLIFLQHQKHL